MENVFAVYRYEYAKCMTLDASRPLDYPLCSVGRLGLAGIQIRYCVENGRAVFLPFYQILFEPDDFHSHSPSLTAIS